MMPMLCPCFAHAVLMLSPCFAHAVPMLCPRYAHAVPMLYFGTNLCLVNMVALFYQHGCLGWL